ncbi:MAG: glycosyltransferase [Allomuricauda sp.]|nr:MAG: glycosyltransferase [Allomuricauda sp.]
MRLSILIPLYNKEKHIDRCLKSLLDQDIPESEYEIVIVDDGSKDNGPSIAANYAEKHQNIKLIRQQNQGPSAARNNCLAAANGNYNYFLDADDFLAPNILNSLLTLAEKNELEILEFNTQKTAENGPFPSAIPYTENDGKIQVIDGEAFVAKHGFRNEAWRYIVGKSLLDATGIKFIEGTLYEDAIFTASLFLKAKRMAKVDMDVHRYVVVENSIVTSKDKAHNLKFIHGMVYAIEHFQGLIKGLNSSNKDYQGVVKKLKGRQQAFTFALIIRTLKYRLLSFKELKPILKKLNVLGAYPLDTKIGGIGNSKTRKIYNLTFVPIFNSKFLLSLGLGIMKLVPNK